jgi:hypothetical protein
VKFSTNRSLPAIGLVSYPSSGNTWIRYLIEAVTGVFTGSFYNDSAIGRRGLDPILPNYIDEKITKIYTVQDTNIRYYK